MKYFLILIVSLFSAVLTGWLLTMLVVGLFCEGFSPNWFCSGHGGAWVFILIGGIVILIPVFFRLYSNIAKEEWS